MSGSRLQEETNGRVPRNESELDGLGLLRVRKFLRDRILLQEDKEVFGFTQESLVHEHDGQLPQQQMSARILDRHMPDEFERDVSRDEELSGPSRRLRISEIQATAGDFRGFPNLPRLHNLSRTVQARRTQNGKHVASGTTVQRNVTNPPVLAEVCHHRNDCSALEQKN